MRSGIAGTASAVVPDATWTDEKTGTGVDCDGLARLMAYVDATAAGTAGGTTEIPG